jgi:AraC-like DNA-binding protein
MENNGPGCFVLAKIAHLKPLAPPSAVVRFLGAGHVTPNPNWGVKAHSHTHHEIIAPMRGKMQVAFAARRETAGAGDLLLYQAGRVHDEQSDRRNPVDMYYVAFEHPAFSAASLPYKTRDRHGRVALLISWLCEERHQRTPAQKQVAERLLESIVAETLRAASEREESELVLRTRVFFQEHLAEPLTLAMPAAHCGLSKHHFLRKFKAAAGHTPMRELRELRLEAARNLLLTTDWPLKEIAPHAGLGDEYHLSRLFHRHFGFTPASLRRRGG